MLQKKPVTDRTLELIQKLLSEDFLSDFNLVGGTSLALRFNHRVSIDIDLFSEINFDPEVLEKKLNSNYKISGSSINEIGLFSFINGIKADFVHYPYTWIRPSEKIKGLRMASLEDIAAMKLSAISKRGTKKDFWDIVYLLERFSFDEMLGFYKEKFKVRDTFHVYKSIIYFTDAENPENIHNNVNALNPKDTWKNIKKIIKNKVLGNRKK